MNRKLIVASSVLLTFGTLAMAQPRMTVFGGAPRDVSASGDIISFSGARFYRGGTPMIQVFGGSGTSGGKLSADGSIVTGSVVNTTGIGGLPTNIPIAARWTDLTGVWQPIALIPDPGHCDSSTINGANGMSADGRFMVGGSWKHIGTSNCRFRAYVYDNNTGVATDLGNAGGAANESTRADDVSADGSIIVGYDASPTTGVWRPAIWVNSGSGYVEQVIPTTGVPSTEGGQIYAINGPGTAMVGTSFAYTHNGYPNLVKWTNSGGTWTAHDLGSMPVHPSWCPLLYALADVNGRTISDDGNVITGSVTYAFGGERVSGAFLWTPELGIVDLYDYLASQGAIGLPENFPSPPYDVENPYSGYAIPSLGSVSAATPDGRTIMGTGLTAGITAWLVDLDGHACTAPVMSLQPSQNSGVFSGTAFINAQAIGSSPMTATWYKDGAVIYEGTTYMTQYRAPAAVCEDAGEYWVTFTNPCGSVTSEHYTVTVCGACNIAGVCSQMSPADCTNNGGAFQGLGTSCINPLCRENLTASGCLGPVDLLQFLNLYFTNYDGHGSAVPGDNTTIPDLNPLSPIYAVPCTPSADGEYPVIPAAGLKADYDADCQVGPTDLLGYLHDYFNPTGDCFSGCFATLAAPKEIPSAGGIKVFKDSGKVAGTKATPAVRR